ncbi:hypothetical protein [Pseudonocardia sp. ICBG162]|uniref:hypothetical protein n=1 Tax=Pseudonocardia sp. ICBG162 TaxID=2846761 RepID=UPI001CF63ECA|nr:hypothetical protein [Pseudonocardia sp. ICBG162]
MPGVPAAARATAADSVAQVGEIAAEVDGGPLVELAGRAYAAGLSTVGTAGAVLMGTCAVLVLTVLRRTPSAAPDDAATG